MNQPDLRSERRLPAGFHGTLALDDKPVPCIIQNMCSRGFLIQRDKALPIGRVGQVLRLKCELFPARSIECKVQVRHVNAQCFGARVIEMSEDGKVLCQEYLKRNAPPA